MNRFFIRLLVIFSSAMLLFLIILICIFLLGFQNSLSEWQKNREEEYSGYALKILSGNMTTIPEDIPFFVYNPHEELVFSNRGKRKFNSGDILPVYSGNNLIGYFFAGYMDFVFDEANIRFLNSLYNIFIIASVLSFLIAFFVSAVLSRLLSRQAEKVSGLIKTISTGNYNIDIPEKGVKEISQIAASANSLAKQLKKEQELRTQWAEDLAHDLRTPLSALIAQFEGMRDGVLDMSGERIEKNLKEINRIKQLIYDIDELARLDSPELRLKPQKIDSTVFLNELKEQFAFEADKKNADLNCIISVQEFTGDKQLLFRALANTLSNAVRHTHKNGRIEISIERKNNSVVINIFNTGDKIPDNEISKVFDRLYRGEYARNTPGTGLGLTIASKIAKLHKGTVSIKSNNTGTAVIIEFPDKDISGLKTN